MPLTGHVDRNLFPTWGEHQRVRVVPLTGHVDRNRASFNYQPAHLVVPLTGHVDRNFSCYVRNGLVFLSCPSRGTWIEMCHSSISQHHRKVVPLTGHVDRNTVLLDGCCAVPLSCPSRGTWIEIFRPHHQDFSNYGRAPHGARG